ncbi:MAG: hypothetical protein EXQ49_01005 [Acidobacteria bacterium]|nr:hypothetical protein [Acidobacteriota bacterium]
MSRLICGFIVLLGIAFATGVEAQQKPDFTGTWVVVTPADSAGQEQFVRHTPTTLSTGHASEGDGHNASYKLDGSESRNELGSHGQVIVTISKAVWEGATLVITSSTTYSNGGKMDSKQIWSMDSEGRLVVEHTQTEAGQPTRSGTVVHTKKTT